MPKSLPLDPRDELRRKASALNLPDPEYQILSMDPNKIAKERTVYAKVKVRENFMQRSMPIRISNKLVA